ncbi:MAG: ABC transporter substrate-binding protein [Spirochaetaceae bacterium]|nr:ABC transporter substrate-binding protein [Spirochaetaceae bacterium]
MATIAQINAEYDPDKARQLLGELGLKDQSGDGMLQYEDGGNVTFLLGAASEITAHVNLAEMVVADWKAGGIDARLHLQTRSLMFSGIRDLQFHAVTFGTTDLLFPQFRLNEGPIMPGYQSPLFVEDPPDDLQKIWDLTDQIITTVDADKVSMLMKEHQRLRAENNLGIWAAHDVPLMVIVHNRLQNVPTADEIVIDNADHIPLMPDQWFIQE